MKKFLIMVLFAAVTGFAIYLIMTDRKFFGFGFWGKTKPVYIGLLIFGALGFVSSTFIKN